MGETAIHSLVERCRAAQMPSCVGSLESGWVIMAERQVLRGYCLLLPDPVVAQLNDLKDDRRDCYLRDLGRLGDVLLSVTGAVRVNYAIFGNLEPALHAHVFPRYADEPIGTRTSQPWALDWDQSPAYSAQLYGELRERIGAALLLGA